MSKMKKIRSAWPIYITALFALLYSLVLPIYDFKFLLVGACLGIIVYVISSKFIPGRVVEAPTSTGIRELDAQIASGRALLDSLDKLNAQIPDAQITANLNRMDAAGREIFRAVERETAKASQVRKFLNYYLPTTEKLIGDYRELMEVQKPGEHVTNAMNSIKSSLSMVADAFERQLDNLFKEDTLDITSDVDVLETMIASEGLNAGDMSDIINRDKAN